MIQTSEGNLPQGLDTAIRTGLERGRRTVARRARVRRGLCCTRCCKALRPNGKNRPGRQNVRGGFCIVWQRNAAGTAGAGLSKNVQGSA